VACAEGAGSAGRDISGACETEAVSGWDAGIVTGRNAGGGEEWPDWGDGCEGATVTDGLEAAARDCPACSGSTKWGVSTEAKGDAFGEAGSGWAGTEVPAAEAVGCSCSAALFPLCAPCGCVRVCDQRRNAPNARITTAPQPTATPTPKRFFAGSGLNGLFEVAWFVSGSRPRSEHGDNSTSEPQALSDRSVPIGSFGRGGSCAGGAPMGGCALGSSLSRLLACSGPVDGRPDSISVPHPPQNRFPSIIGAPHALHFRSAASLIAEEGGVIGFGCTATRAEVPHIRQNRFPSGISALQARHCIAIE